MHLKDRFTALLMWTFLLEKSPVENKNINDSMENMDKEIRRKNSIKKSPRKTKDFQKPYTGT